MKSPIRDTTDDLRALVSMLGHDVRNSARALAEVPIWIKEDLADMGQSLPDGTEDHLRLIEIHAARLNKMLNDLITFSRIGQANDVQTIDLDATLTATLAELHLPPRFVVHRDLRCPQLQIGQKDFDVFLKELLRNAVKHHHLEAGNIYVSSYLNDGECIITVSDDGPGVPDMHKKTVLEPMKTLRPRDEIEGSGMGLAIAKRVVDFYRGRFVLKDGRDGCGSALEASFDASYAAIDS